MSGKQKKDLKVGEIKNREKDGMEIRGEKLRKLDQLNK